LNLRLSATPKKRLGHNPGFFWQDFCLRRVRNRPFVFADESVTACAAHIQRGVPAYDPVDVYVVFSYFFVLFVYFYFDLLFLRPTASIACLGEACKVIFVFKACVLTPRN
jgi:hypothetical protein